LLAGLFLVLPHALYSQQDQPAADSSGSAVIKGKVINAKTGEPISGATIKLVGTYKGAYTKEDGTYRIKGVRKGAYTLRFGSLGFAKLEVTGVKVDPGAVKTVNAELTKQELTTETVEIRGDPNMVDLESGESSVTISEDQIKDMAVEGVQDIVALQAGVTQTPDGLQVRGGRVYETQYLVDGISAQDPLAGTGFGVKVSDNAIKELELITGGAGAEYAGGTAGIVSTQIKEGGPEFQVSGSYKRDNVGVNPNGPGRWNTDNAKLSISGPLLPFLNEAPDGQTPMREKLFFFVSGNMRIHDTYFGAQADQLDNSLVDNNEFWAPRQSNSWSGTAKLTYKITPGTKLSLSMQQSMKVNQNSNTLQIIGNDEVLQPGFQFQHSLNLDNANTFAHKNNLMTLNFTTTLSEHWSMHVSAGRLFTNLRADANGRPFRDTSEVKIKDPRSIVTEPVTVFNPGDSVTLVNPGPGLYNNGGIATMWHDHYAQEYTGKIKFNFQPESEVHYITLGWQHQEQEYQWIDVSRPWVGAPVRLNDSTTFSSNRIGTSSEIWKVRPAEGGFFFSDRIRYNGIIADLGLRASYWARGQSIDEAVNDSLAPVLDVVREEYKEQTVKIGRRFKMRLLPRLKVSFPVTDNNVLYFNYAHSLRQPHPRFVNAGLDPKFLNRSFLSSLGNPNLDPETTVSYEVGLKSQLGLNSALTVTAYYNDKYDYIVNRSVTIRDRTGRFVEKSFFINQDYARIRGLEITYFHRIGEWFRGTISGSYQLATGKSNSARESKLQIQRQGEVVTTDERPLAWDRPWDIKAHAIIRTPQDWKPFHNFRIFVSSTFKSGLRYTPYERIGTDEATGRPEFERQDEQRNGRLGAPWFWTDLKITRDFYLNNKRTRFVSLFFEVERLFNHRNAAIVNPVTGDAYQQGDPVPDFWRDPRFPNPLNAGTPPDNPARYLQPRHFLAGVEFKF
jgi:outer membrane receptor protein involved in Fe transport